MAPAGFGKTTLLAEWCEEMRAKQHHMAWLSLDHEDDELQQFGAYIVASLCKGPGGVGHHAADLLSNDPLTPAKTVVSVLLNEIGASSRQVFLVLDDVDRLTSAPVRATLSRMLRYGPENFHMLFGVRSEPVLSLGQFSTTERLLRLDATDLRFSVDDAHAFFSVATSASLDRRSVELLTNATEGWAVGLRLASIALGRSNDAAQVARDLTGVRGEIDAYLNDTVLAQLPPPMQQFLLRTSILDRLSGGVCDAIMGTGARSWEKLDWLEQHNLFIRALDEKRHWFRYHALMADALRHRLERQLPDEQPGLHRRASRWFASENLWPEAVRHALAAGELQQAAIWVEQFAMELVARADVRTVLGWIGKLPDDLMKGRPKLQLTKAWALALSLQTSEATRVVHELSTDFAEIDHRTPSGRHADPTLAAGTYAVSAMIGVLSDDIPKALELGRLAAAEGAATPWERSFADVAQLAGLMYEGRFDEVRRMELSPVAKGEHTQGPIFGEIYRESLFGLSALLEGQLAQGVQILESALKHAENAVGRDSAAAAVPAGYLAVLYYERNDLPRAWQLVTGYSSIALEASPLGSLLRYCRAAIRLYARVGDYDAALLFIEEARQIAISRQWLRLRAGCDAEAVRLYLRNGQLERAQETGEALLAAMPRQHPFPTGTFIETWASYCEMQARIYIATGRIKEAVALLDDLRGKLSATGMAYLEARSSILLALALVHEQSEGSAAALASLDRALRYAHRNELIGSFVDEGEPLLDLLRDWRRSGANAGIEAGFLDRLEAAFNEVKSVPAATPAARVCADAVLSAREFEVLDQMSRGLSNKEIGRALRLAPETIKWHLKNIFEKLGVSSRIEAVHVGLGLVPTSHRALIDIKAVDASRRRSDV
ncbi:LuxR C-terminal-related transcriptional regulator [Variovorax sp. J22R133]|uniref:LuxR C-terminal-related transcriptional regulator n=1 Tax=Variovorax brevis TaxID=3053503 RepID=UPI002578F20C|nr:LuxR C-terminal-related transcriptional regulator [Variovorax sp. J22R133]MDM0116274.1 LuxR C-terminal-related transcriptional regulator [Variovorax sp. J22R133]